MFITPEFTGVSLLVPVSGVPPRWHKGGLQLRPQGDARRPLRGVLEDGRKTSQCYPEASAEASGLRLSREIHSNEQSLAGAAPQGIRLPGKSRPSKRRRMGLCHWVYIT